jgi:hypothetical protein
MRSRIAVPLVLAFLAACGSNGANAPGPTPEIAVTPVAGSGGVGIVFAGSSLPPGSTVTGCGATLDGCGGRLRMTLVLHPRATGHVLAVRVYLHASNQTACLSGRTDALDLRAGEPVRVEVPLAVADDCATPVTIVSMDGIVEGTTEVASRQEWTLRYVFAR